MDKVILSTGKIAFGGARISNGVASADLWSDGEVLGAAWSMTQPEIEGSIFSFRGSLRRSKFATRRDAWRLLDAQGEFIATFPTRQAALDSVIAKVTMDAFKALRAAS